MPQFYQEIGAPPRYIVVEVVYNGTFYLPRDLYHGKGSMEELKNLKGSKAMVVVGGGGMKRFGFWTKLWVI